MRTALSLAPKLQSLTGSSINAKSNRIDLDFDLAPVLRHRKTDLTHDINPMPRNATPPLPLIDPETRIDRPNLETHLQPGSDPLFTHPYRCPTLATFT